MGWMDVFHNAIQEMAILEHRPNWEHCWGNVSNGSYQQSYPWSTFSPDRSLPQEEYKMYPSAWGHYDNYEISADHYGPNGFELEIKDFAISKYTDKNPPVGHFVWTGQSQPPPTGPGGQM